MERTKRFNKSALTGVVAAALLLGLTSREASASHNHRRYKSRVVSYGSSYRPYYGNSYSYGRDWQPRRDPNGDWDKDGISNHRDRDDDNDGIRDSRDRNDYSTVWRGRSSSSRRDRDRDGIRNGRDRHPRNPWRR